MLVLFAYYLVWSRYLSSRNNIHISKYGKGTNTKISTYQVPLRGFSQAVSYNRVFLIEWEFLWRGSIEICVSKSNLIHDPLMALNLQHSLVINEYSWYCWMMIIIHSEFVKIIHHIMYVFQEKSSNLNA